MKTKRFSHGPPLIAKHVCVDTICHLNLDLWFVYLAVYEEKSRLFSCLLALPHPVLMVNIISIAKEFNACQYSVQFVSECLGVVWA